MSTIQESEATRQAVRQQYAGIARHTMAESAETSVESCCAGDRTELQPLAVIATRMMNHPLVWSLTLVPALAAYLWGGPTPLSTACPPSPNCPCP